MKLHDLQTPALLLDEAVLRRNCAAMSERMAARGVRLRPHMKTAKSADVAAIATAGHFGGITVSTLAEARYFAEQGYRDITYAVGMAPGKLGEIMALHRQGIRLSVLLDNATALQAAAEATQQDAGSPLPVLIEIDSGGGRGGIDPDGPDLPGLGQGIGAAPGLALEGVLTHAGHAYHCRSIEDIQGVAREEAEAVVRAARRLRETGLDCAVVSAGSTPTAVHGEAVPGVTEMRPGVYMFFDLDQLALRSCAPGDLALSVLASVIGHNRRAGRILIDAGALALSKDVSANEFDAGIGYGLIARAEEGAPLPGLYVAEVHQEHGLIASRKGEPPYGRFPVGSRVRVLLNHACITAAAYDRYHLIGELGEVTGFWARINGW